MSAIVILVWIACQTRGATGTNGGAIRVTAQGRQEFWTVRKR